MKFMFADLWRPTGTVDRRTYALVGALGFALKHNLDRIIATLGFHRPWGLFNYWVPMRSIGRITQLSSDDTRFLGTMLLAALPFIWIGVVMTLKRLQSAGLPAWLVALFFVPFANLLFFIVLCLVPERGPMPVTALSKPSFFTRVVPDSQWGSAAFSFLLTVPIGIAFVLLGTNVLVTYGWGMFVALPFATGLAAAVVYGIHGPRTLSGCIVVANLSVAILGLSLLTFAVEGVVCLVMAVPIAIPLASFGGACGYMAQRQRWFHNGLPVVASAFLLFVPSIQWFEHTQATQPPVFVVHSTIDIDATPETVWKSVVAFTEIPPPTELIFKAGVAYPIRAEIFGRGPGAERHCVFSTGQFVEPIEIWDEPRQLKFSVTSNPPPLQEWTPYQHVVPSHLHGFLVSSGGQFLLTRLPSGRTQLEGTTWYRHGLWPASYWRLWSDAIIHRIHMRVLEHIRREAERAASGH